MTKIAKQREKPTADRRANAPPLSRPLVAASVPAAGVDVVIRASEAECAALARENAVVGVLWLEAPFHAARFGRDGLKVRGAVRAAVRQSCVVTLEEFDTVLEEPVSVRFAPQTQDHPSHGQREKPLSAEDALDIEDDGSDPLIGGVVDLGALAAEFLALGLDPYPHKPGAQFQEPAPAAPEESPFTVLSKRGAGLEGE